MLALLFLFLLAILSSTTDIYDYAFSRKKGKRLPKNAEYAEVIARYVNDK